MRSVCSDGREAAESARAAGEAGAGRAERERARSLEAGEEAERAGGGTAETAVAEAEKGEAVPASLIGRRGEVIQHSRAGAGVCLWVGWGVVYSGCGDSMQRGGGEGR